MPFRSSTRRYSPRKVRGARRTRSGVARAPRKMGRVYRRRSVARAPPRLPQRWSNPLAVERHVKFHYSDSGFPLTTGPGGVSSIIVHNSSPYDPYTTGIGVQPYDWDTLMNASEYGQYYVLGAKITVRFYFVGAPNTVICSLIASMSPALTYTGADDLRVNPDCVQRTMNEVSKGTLTLTMYRSIRKMCARDPSDGTSWYNTNPPSSLRFYFYAIADSTNMAAPVAVGCDVDMTFYTIIRRVDTVNES